MTGSLAVLTTQFCASTFSWTNYSFACTKLGTGAIVWIMYLWAAICLTVYAMTNLHVRVEIDNFLLTKTEQQFLRGLLDDVENLMRLDRIRAGCCLCNRAQYRHWTPFPWPPMGARQFQFISAGYCILSSIGTHSLNYKADASSNFLKTLGAEHCLDVPSSLPPSWIMPSQPSLDSQENHG